MLTLNLSTISGQISAGSKGRSFWCDCAAQGFDECHCNDYLMFAEGDDDDTRTVLIAEDPTDDPHDSRNGGGGHKIAHLERCLDVVMEDPGEVTTPQFTPIETVSAWIAWSQGQPIAKACPPDCGCIWCT